MAGIVEGKKLEECVDMGQWLASLSIKELGPQYVEVALYLLIETCLVILNSWDPSADLTLLFSSQVSLPQANLPIQTQVILSQHDRKASRFQQLQLLARHHDRMTEMDLHPPRAARRLT